MIKMNKVTAFGALLMAFSFGSQAMAMSMECSVGMNRATAGGLYPVEREVVLKTAVVQSGDVDLQKCSSTQLQNFSISLCAIEDSEAAGIFHAEIAIFNKDQDQRFTAGKNLLAIAKKGSDLVTLTSASALTPSFEQKMESAGVAFPDYSGGDSLMIDEAVVKGFKKGAITNDDIVSVGIANCKLK